MKLRRTRTTVAAGGLVLAGFAGGAALVLGGAADAAGSSSTSQDAAQDGHGGETPLTGTTADKVRAAALARYPGATVDRLETDSDGVYEAHVTTKAGDDVVVEVGKDFTVTGTQTGGRHGGLGGPGDHGGPGGHGGHAGETPLTGTTADKVRAAALARYPGATVDRLETDSDGVYEAHVTTKAGDDVIVEVGKDFTVTGTQAGGGHGHR